MLINIKPLSVNKCYSGRRIKTEEYLAYEKELLIKLQNVKIPDDKIAIYVQFGFSSKGSDIDNCVKTFLDVLQKKYRFNDNRIYRLIVDKYIVKKGEEYINFDIFELKR